MSTATAAARLSLARPYAARVRDSGVLVALAAVCVVFSVATDAFLTTANLRSLVEQMAEPGLIACGMTAVIIAGEFDLSVGAIFGFGGVVAAIVESSTGILLAMVAGLAAGASIGALNGAIVARGGIESFLVTLATQFVIVGVAIFVTGGKNVWQLNDAGGFGHLAHDTLLGVEYPAWAAGAVVAVLGLLLRRTRWGAQVYAVGGNVAAARVAGARVDLVRISVFVVSGVLAALAGVFALADSGLAQGDGGIGMEFSAITAVIIGGTSIAGGRGSVWRTLVGLLLLTVIANGFTLLYVDPTYNLLVQGAIILAAVLVDARLKTGTS
jgi:ribose transport system permease protein